MCTLTIIVPLLDAVKIASHDTSLIETAAFPLSVLLITETKGNRLYNIYSLITSINNRISTIIYSNNITDWILH